MALETGVVQKIDQRDFIDAAEFRKLNHINAAFARFALRDERGMGAELLADFRLGEARFVPCLT